MTIEKHNGFTIEQAGSPDFPYYNVTCINCFAAHTVEECKRAIDSYAAKRGLCIHGCYLSSTNRACDCKPAVVLQ